MPAKPSTPTSLDFPCAVAKQGDTELVLFAADADVLYRILEINQRDPDKDKGYQRTLSMARVVAISKYFKSKKVLPMSLLVSFNHATLSPDKRTITIPNKRNAGWVIDGQHRLAGAHEAKEKIQLPIVAFLNLPTEKQIEQFVTINREAKGVPTSLYFDLLSHLPHTKSDGEAAKERAADIANEIKRDESSPFFNRIVIMTSPKAGEMSLNNFVRKVAPLVHRKTGKFGQYNEIEQRKIINNLFQALDHIFLKQFKDEHPIWFQTIGFGAVMNQLPLIFDLALKQSKGFRVEDVTKLLRNIADFSFTAWKDIGTGSAAEVSAGEELKATLVGRLADSSGDSELTVRL